MEFFLSEWTPHQTRPDFIPKIGSCIGEITKNLTNHPSLLHFLTIS